MREHGVLKRVLRGVWRCAAPGRVGVAEGLDQLGVRPRLLHVRQVIGRVPALVQIMPTWAVRYPLQSNGFGAVSSA